MARSDEAGIPMPPPELWNCALLVALVSRLYHTFSSVPPLITDHGSLFGAFLQLLSMSVIIISIPYWFFVTRLALHMLAILTK